MRRTTTGAAAVLAATMLVAGCTASDAPDEPTSTADDAGRGATEDGGAAGSPGDRDGDASTDGDADADGQGEAAGADPDDPAAFSTAERARETGEPGTLVAVATGTAGDVDTLRFEFDGSLPTYQVGYVERLLLGEDEPLEVEGGASLQVAFEEATPGADGMTSEDVPTNEAYDLAVLRQVLLVENLGGAVRFGVGVTEQVAFRVVEEDTALLVELEHP